MHRKRGVRIVRTAGFPRALICPPSCVAAKGTVLAFSIIGHSYLGGRGGVWARWRVNALGGVRFRRERTPHHSDMCG